jgi:sigma-B regulation protein RsbU (phosphoserine phosphatase)
MSAADASNLSHEHLATLYQITGVMNSSLDFNEALQNIIGAVMQATRGQRGYLMRYDEEHDDVEVLVSTGADGGDTEGYSTTITSEVIRTRQTLLTNNAQFDSRYQAGQSIILRGLRAILCAPMMVKDRLIGLIYVDTSMRKGNFTPEDRDLMAAVAGQAAVALENARLYSLAVEQGRLMRELQMAREIQQNLLPHRMPDIAGYQVAAHWQAAREVAGDFYDVFELDAERFAVVIADVSDKGAPAAMFMAVARTMIRTLAHTGLTPLETIASTNDLILEDAESGMFVTVYYSVFSRGGSSVHVNAGHNPIVVYRAAERHAFLMPRGGRAIGWFPDNPLKMLDLDLQPGDIVIFYTDGLTEAENALGDFFGEERLMKVVTENAHLGADDLLAAILNAATAFCGAVAPFDDQTVVVVRHDG